MTVLYVMTESWERFFDNHAPNYMRNRFTAHTKAEVSFILKELSLPPKAHILDIGCGTGRHSIELTKRGYQVTAIDISRRMLAEAERRAQQEGVNVEWIRSDAAQFRSTRLFDAAICLCEGAFGLLSADDSVRAHEFNILSNIAAALKPNSHFILTTLNGLKIREITQEDVETNRFDLITMVELITSIDLPEGAKSVRLRQKFYTPPEIIELLGEAGFHTEKVWGGTAGEWRRRKIRLDEIEFMIVSRKTNQTPQTKSLIDRRRRRNK